MCGELKFRHNTARIKLGSYAFERYSPEHISEGGRHGIVGWNKPAWGMREGNFLWHFFLFARGIP